MTIYIVTDLHEILIQSLLLNQLNRNKRALLLPEAACALFSCYCAASLKSAFQLPVSQQSKIIPKQKVSCSDTAESQFECHPSLCFTAITKLL